LARWLARGDESPDRGDYSITPDEWLLDETREWLRRALSDLRAARICEPELPAEALFAASKPKPCPVDSPHR
jgi:hypothetical protein